eukprot:symbB.v1.2.031981.t1/scaffold3775.1/size50518/6
MPFLQVRFFEDGEEAEPTDDEPEDSVLNLSCQQCSRLLCQRGMRVRLVSDGSISLFSTDFRPEVHEAQEQREHGMCRCCVRDVLCACGCTVGYHVIVPCTGCASSRQMLRARPSNSLTDLILSIELFSLLFLWLREWPNVKGRHELFVSYGLNLLGAACWCATGAPCGFSKLTFGQKSIRAMVEFTSVKHSKRFPSDHSDRVLRLASTKSVGQSADADTLHAGLGLPSKLGGSGGVTKARICQKQPN